MASPEHSADYADLGDFVAVPHIETKPFFLTSEFAVVAAALAALGVTAAMSEVVDALQFWLLATALVTGYLFSRGFSKAAAPSRSWDPRETLLERWGTDSGGGGVLRRNDGGSRGQTNDEEETREMSTVQREDYGSRGGVSQGYGYGPSYGYGRGFGMRQSLPIETKPFFLTSEFWAAVAAIVGLAIGAGTSEQIDARLFWQLATAITIGYMISRGIAKSGTKSRSWDPREDLMDRVRPGRDREGAAS
jgi:hypothetical protein